MARKKSVIMKVAGRGSWCLLLILSWMNVLAQDDPADARRVEWLKTHAVRLDSIDPAADDFADLMPFKRIMGEAKVVLLGEQSHGDGATFHAKTRVSGRRGAMANDPGRESGFRTENGAR